MAGQWAFVGSSVLLAAACGGAPMPAETTEATPTLPARRAVVTDDCALQPGKPAPKPLQRQYTGVAAKARCDREVYTIMGGLTHFLGVKCAYCHDESDYSVMTHEKHVANWMARELIPALRSKSGGEVWCNDCHVVDGKGTAKIGGKPRDQRWVVEWMTTHLVERFESADRKPLRCKSCHEGNLGTPQFQRKIILTDRLPGRPDSSSPEDAGVSP